MVTAVTTAVISLLLLQVISAYTRSRCIHVDSVEMNKLSKAEARPAAGGHNPLLFPHISNI